MPSVPTLTLTTGDGFIAAQVTNPDGDYNILERSSPNEYDGEFIIISENLPINSLFVDYNVASGELYAYRATAVDSSTTAQSAIAQESITLTDEKLHAVTRLNATTNLYGSLLSLTGLIPHERSFSVASQSYLYAGSTLPDIRLSAIEENEIGLTLFIQWDFAAVRAVRDIYMLKLYVCFRDTLGNKLFGTLAPYRESYGLAGMVSIPVVFREEGFSEALS